MILTGNPYWKNGNLHNFDWKSLLKSSKFWWFWLEILIKIIRILMILTGNTYWKNGNLHNFHWKSLLKSLKVSWFWLEILIKIIKNLMILTGNPDCQNLKFECSYIRGQIRLLGGYICLGGVYLSGGGIFVDNRGSFFWTSSNHVSYVADMCCTFENGEFHELTQLGNKELLKETFWNAKRGDHLKAEFIRNDGPECFLRNIKISFPILKPTEVLMHHEKCVVTSSNIAVMYRMCYWPKTHIVITAPERLMYCANVRRNAKSHLHKFKTITHKLLSARSVSYLAFQPSHLADWTDTNPSVLLCFQSLAHLLSATDSHPLHFTDESHEHTLFLSTHRVSVCC